MSNSADPSIYRERERQYVDHVERLLSDDRLRVDTLDGRRPVVSLRRDVVKEDREVELIRRMAESGVYDRELQGKMPVGQMLTVSLSRPWWFFLRKTVGRVRLVCLSPTRELIEGRAPAKLTREDVRGALAQFGGKETGDAPTTVVVVSTSGFEPEARDLVERTNRRTVVLAEPNEAGGWLVRAPAETGALSDLLDPELEADKRRRIREVIEEDRAELLSGGLGAERISARTQLPPWLVETELKSYAGENPGLVAKRLGGHVVLFREGTGPAPSAEAGGVQMPFIQRIRALFSGKADNQRKIAMLSERRAALSLQRDKSFEEMGVLEQKEADLREQFKGTTSNLTKRRITSQLLQLRKDLERRQQLLGVLNQQVNIISTHLHNLELVQQGDSAQLPDSEELANDAAAAEETLAQLQADGELAASIGATTTAGGLSEEEQALYEELEREAAAAEPLMPEAAPKATAPAAEKRAERREAAEPPPLPERPERPRREAEPG